MITPTYLKAGDQVCILSTARKISPSEIAPAQKILSSWGLKVIEGQHLYDSDHQFAGTDENRLSDLQDAINNPQIKAILCARGGYGTSRILDQLDLNPLISNPKWIIGFSDVTALHLHLQHAGIESIHAIMPIVFEKPNSEKSLESLKKALFGEKLTYVTEPHTFNTYGESKGRIVGGNLSLVNHIIGTGSEPDWNGKILFLEDIDEYLYHIDRLMLQLNRTGILKSLAGVIVGHFTDMKDNAIPFGMDAYEIIRSHVDNYGYPVVFGFPVGHEADNRALICGRLSSLKVDETGAALIQ